jgi:hypothetical protein
VVGAIDRHHCPVTPWISGKTPRARDRRQIPAQVFSYRVQGPSFTLMSRVNCNRHASVIHFVKSECYPRFALLIVLAGLSGDPLAKNRAAIGAIGVYCLKLESQNGNPGL